MAAGLRSSRHVKGALRYARAVLAGDIPACKWVKAACQRQLDDIERSRTDPSWPYVWDLDRAHARCAFIELLPHVKGGQWEGQHIALEMWQQFVITVVFGWVHRETRLRRFRSAYLEVGRKNAKTTLLAAMALSALTIDRELGAEVYSAATTRDQAKIVFSIARKMAQLEPEFRAQFGVKIFENALSVDAMGARMVPLSAEGSTLDGLNTHFAAIDELHAHKTRTVHDVIDSSLGSRAQPLIFKITTSGSDRAGVCYDVRLYITKILNAVLMAHGGLGYKIEGNRAEDDTAWGIIYTLDAGEEKDPFNEANWIKANPNLGVSVDIDDMRRMARMAMTQTAALGEFLTKRLDVWIGADTGWMNMLDWEACGDSKLTEKSFTGHRCFIGLDAAFKRDLFAKVKVFTREIPDAAGVKQTHYYAFGRYYTHRQLIEAEGNEQLAGWERDGWLRASAGNVTDIADVREELAGDGGDLQRFELAELAFDPAQIQQFASEMIDEGLPMVEVRPLILHFSPAMKELDELVTARRFHHNGDPMLAWMIANVVCHRDSKDNIYPRKERPENKIDGAIALIMAMSRALLAKPQGESYYSQVARESAPPVAIEALDEEQEAALPPPIIKSYWEQVAEARLQPKQHSDED